MRRTVQQTSTITLIAIVSFTLACFSGKILGQNSQSDVYVETELSRTSVYVGDEISFSISIYNARNPDQPQVDFPDGVSVVYHGRSLQSYTSMHNENGRRRTVTQRFFTFQYTLTAIDDGEIVIPESTVIDDGINYAGKPAQFQSLLPSRSQDDVLELSIKRNTLYLNETIEIECSWFFNNPTSQFKFSSSAFPDSFEIRPVSPPRGTPEVVNFPLRDQNIQGYVESVTRGGQSFRRFAFTFSITPTEIGTFDLGPLRSIFTRQSGTGSRFRAYVESEMLTVEVVPVPLEGKPSTYEGAMGSFSLESRASNQRVHVGDPIEIMLRVQGQEPMTGVQDAPSLEATPEFASGFKLDSAGWREDMPRREGVRIYRTTIRALSDAVKQIPPIELPAFDPELGRYRVYATKPIPLDVTAVKEVTLADAIVSGDRELQPAPRRPEIERVELTTASPGLWAHANADTLTSQQHFDVVETLQTPIWITSLCTPPAAYLALVLAVRHRRNRDEHIVNAKQALHASRRSQGINALKIYLSKILDIDLDALTGADIEQLNASIELREKAHDCLVASEAGITQSSAPETRELIKRIHAEHVAALKEGES